MKIYIVHGTTGEYSDRTEWVVNAYHTEMEAETAVTNYCELARVAGMHSSQGSSGDGEEPPEMLKHALRNSHVSYTGVNWYVTETELIEQGALAPMPFTCPLCGQHITDGKPCGCGARR